MDTRSDRLFVGPDWKHWIAENLLLGHSPQWHFDYDLRRAVGVKPSDNSERVRMLEDSRPPLACGYHR
jgi:hypothetical protein